MDVLIEPRIHESITLDRSKYAPDSGVGRGAYVLADSPAGNPEVILIASGSEVILAVQAHEKLLADGIRSRVVSMPSWDIFEHQTRDYQDSVLPPRVKARVAVEQASTLGWERYVGPSGRVIGMRTFGASAPLKQLQKKLSRGRSSSPRRRRCLSRASGQQLALLLSFSSMIAPS